MSILSTITRFISGVKAQPSRGGCPKCRWGMAFHDEQTDLLTCASCRTVYYLIPTHHPKTGRSTFASSGDGAIERTDHARPV